MTAKIINQYTGFINNSNEPKCDTIQMLNEVNGVYLLRAATNVHCRVLTDAMIYAGRTTCASTVHCDMHVMQRTSATTLCDVINFHQF